LLNRQWHCLPPRRELLAPGRLNRGERAFMITGIGDHDRPEWPFIITGMRTWCFEHVARRFGMSPGLAHETSLRRGLS
jgi:hypothetical protein